MGISLKKNKDKALGAAPAKTGKPETPKAKPAKAKKAEVIDVAPANDPQGVSIVDRQEIALIVVETLSDIFNQLVNGLSAEPPIDSDDDDQDDDSQADDDDDEEEVKPSKAKAAKGAKKKAPKQAEPEEDDDDDDDDDDATASDSDYDPDPFRGETLELAEEAVKEFNNKPKEIKDILTEYLKGAPEDAPATVKIQKLFDGKKVEEAWKHLVALLIDDEGNVHDFSDAYIRGESFLYLGGVEAVPVEDTGFTPVSKAKLVSLEDGSESKAPKDITFSQILHNPVEDTYFGLTDDQSSIIEVEESE